MNIFKKKLIVFSLFSSFFFASSLSAQHSIFNQMDMGEGIDELDSGTDIFTDFSDSSDNTQIAEDEFFYSYGRFFTFALGLGLTTFNGNRGKAYEDNFPSYSAYIQGFTDFYNAFTLGLSYSSHHFWLPDPTVGHNLTVQGDEKTRGPGIIEVGMLRFFLGFRHYIDTTDLSTAITYSNPYFTGRLEYWYTTKKFIDIADSEKESGGGLGFGLGGGLEFPVILRKSYLCLEFLVHTVNFYDKNTQAYRPLLNTNGVGFDDMTGFGFSTLAYYVFNW